MSGTPSQAEIFSQWTKAVAVLEALRVYADGTLAGAGGDLDDLIQALEGEFTPALAQVAENVRSGVSALISPSQARSFLEPVIREYGAQTLTNGSGYSSIADLMVAIREYFDDNSYTIRSREITWDTSYLYGGGTLFASNAGTVELLRLYLDASANEMEAVTVETKRFRCRQDQNSGVDEHAEVFEVLGDAASKDNLLIGNYGSGINGRGLIVGKHAGSGPGGSLLQNAAFGTYSATASPKFTGWTETAGGAQLSQETTTTYRPSPGVSTTAALKMTGGSGTVTVTQPFSSWRVSALDPNKPIFCRVMVNASAGSASGGSFTITLGSKTATSTIADLVTATGWNELYIGDGTNGVGDLSDCWFENFNADGLSLALSWTSSSSGTLLVADVVLVQWDEVDGTFYVIRNAQNSPLPSLVDDTIELTDTGGAAGTGIVQWWLWRAGLGYLPASDGTANTGPQDP